MENLTGLCSLSIALNVVLAWLLFSAEKRSMSLIDDCFYFMGEITRLRQKIKELEK